MHLSCQAFSPFGLALIGMKKKPGTLLVSDLGHKNMHRVLNPHDSPEGFHPLQKQHQIRYHDFNEMYDDAQGFVRKPADEGRVK